MGKCKRDAVRCGALTGRKEAIRAATDRLWWGSPEDGVSSNPVQCKDEDADGRRGKTREYEQVKKHLDRYRGLISVLQYQIALIVWTVRPCPFHPSTQLSPRMTSGFLPNLGNMGNRSKGSRKRSAISSRPLVKHASPTLTFAWRQIAMSCIAP